MKLLVTCQQWIIYKLQVVTFSRHFKSSSEWACDELVNILLSEIKFSTRSHWKHIKGKCWLQSEEPNELWKWNMEKIKHSFTAKKNKTFECFCCGLKAAETRRKLLHRNTFYPTPTGSVVQWQVYIYMSSTYQYAGFRCDSHG